MCERHRLAARIPAADDGADEPDQKTGKRCERGIADHVRWCLAVVAAATSGDAPIKPPYQPPNA